MKQLYSLFLLFASILTFGQANLDKYDYFVQFNGNQLSKKVEVDQVLNHPIITKFTSKTPDFDFRKYTSIIKLDQKITIHGSFLDSVPYYQVTIPIKNKEDVKQFLVENLKAEQNAIQDFGKYAVFTPKGVKRTLAWNDNFFVIFELTKRLPTKFYKEESAISAVDSVATIDYFENDTIAEAPAVYDVPAPPVYTSPKDEAPAVTEVSPKASDIILDVDPYDQNPYETYSAEQAEFDRKLAENQSKIIKQLFENGFTAPTSSKITIGADISSWVDYGGMISTLYSAYSYPMRLFGGFDKYLPMQKNFGNFVKGINLDFYFDNDNARIEEIVEYSKEIAEAVSKIGNRKINKNIFNYFPANKPLGYMSYHFNTEEALEKFPSLMTDMFQNPKFTKEDIVVITDLISTIVDEKATAKLFDGDLSAFLHDVKEVEVMTKKYGYDENYEEKITEEKEKKTIPLFTVVFTSTHPTFGDKLLQLGVRKKLLAQNGNYYQILGTKEYGDMYILKDKDVVAVSNTLDYFGKGNGSFVKETKKDLSRNAIFGQLNISQTIKAFGQNAKDDELNKMNRFASQFSDFTMESPKKLIDNKFKFVFKLNSLQNDKNIILQTLDLANDMMASK
ncbi:hypothetical protein [Flavobacterium foetidum]|uniref:hypothetical protein n=1 Tax=Flavobacterium foetidum TaxID=2026681 RepID=UPI0010757593|nr:hypothetical protein [Flavobacterium foetidum]KAF2509057.1 DUF4836 family protein [Flavobacterium foetidum]